MDNSDNYVNMISDMKAEISTNHSNIEHLQEDTHELKESVKILREQFREQKEVNNKTLEAIEEFSIVIGAQSKSVSKIERDANRFKGGLAVILAVGGIATFVVDQFDRIKQIIKMWVTN